MFPARLAQAAMTPSVAEWMPLYIIRNKKDTPSDRRTTACYASRKNATCFNRYNTMTR